MEKSFCNPLKAANMCEETLQIEVKEIFKGEKQQDLLMTEWQNTSGLCIHYLMELWWRLKFLFCADSRFQLMK